MIITVTSHKGGSGKTTTAVHLAHLLAKGAAPTLLIDLDPQGHSAMCLGYDPQPGAFHWLVAERAVRDCCLTARPNLLLLPGDTKTHTAETMIRYERGRLAQTVAQLRAVGDILGAAHVVIDTASSGVLQEAAIIAADVLVLTARVEALGVDGVAAAREAAALLAPETRLVVAPVAYDRRLNEHAANLEILRREFLRVASPIPARVVVAEAQAQGLTCYEVAGGNAVCDAYGALGALVAGVVAE